MSETELLKIFSKNLKRMMKEDNITQEDLANQIGVSRVMVSRYTSGQCLPSLSTTIKIMDVLFCSLDNLIKEN